MRYKVIVSDKAKRLLSEHMAFIAEKDEEAARRLMAELLKAVRSLEMMPERYPYLNEPYIIPNKYHKMFVTGHYLLLYQIRESTVYVDYVLDCRQDYKWLIR